MRVFLAAFVSAFVIAGVAAVVLEHFQKTSDVANTTSGTVLNLEQQGIKTRGW